MLTNLDTKNHSTNASPYFSHLNNATLSNSPKQKFISQIRNQFSPILSSSSSSWKKMQIITKPKSTAIL